MAKTQNTDYPKCWPGCGITGNLISCWWKCKMVQPFWKMLWQFLTKLNILLTYSVATALLGIYPNKLETSVHTKICTLMFSAALFIIAKTLK